MIRLFLILTVFAMSCEELPDDFGRNNPPKLLLSECEEDRTRCDYAKEFIEICELGFWERYTDCSQLDKICFLFEGAARCRDEDEQGPVEVVE